MFKVALVLATLSFATNAFGQRALGSKHACEELPSVLKRAYGDDCWVLCSAQTEARKQLPSLIDQCNAEARAGSFERSGCMAIQDYIKRVLKLEVPESLTCR
jgi:hypothetical protein